MTPEELARAEAKLAELEAKIATLAQSPEQLDSQALTHYDQWAQSDGFLNEAGNILDPRTVPETIGHVAGALGGKVQRIGQTIREVQEPLAGLPTSVQSLAVPVGVAANELNDIKEQGLPAYAYNMARGAVGSVPYAGPFLGYGADRAREALGGPVMTDEERRDAFRMDAIPTAGLLANKPLRAIEGAAPSIARNARIGVMGGREGGILGSMGNSDSTGTANFQRSYETIKDDNFFNEFTPGDPNLATPREVQTPFGVKTEAPIPGYERTTSQDMYVAFSDKAKAAALEVDSLINRAETARRAAPDMAGDMQVLQKNSGPLYEEASQVLGGKTIEQLPIFGKLDKVQRLQLQQVGPEEFLKQRLHIPESQRPFLDMLGEEKFYALHPEYVPGTKEQISLIGAQATAQKMLEEYEATLQRAQGDLSALHKQKQNYDELVQNERTARSKGGNSKESYREKLAQLAADGLRITIEELGEKYGSAGIGKANERYGAYTEGLKMIGQKKLRQETGVTRARAKIPLLSKLGFDSLPISQTMADKFGLGFANNIEVASESTKLPIKAIDVLTNPKALGVLNSLIKQSGAVRPGLNFEDMPPQLQSEMYDLIRRNFSGWFVKPIEGYFSIGADGRIKDPMELDYHKQQALDPSIPESKKAQVFSAINDRGLYLPTKEAQEAQDLRSLDQGPEAPDLDLLSKALSGIGADPAREDQDSTQMGPDTSDMLQAMQRYKQGINAERSGL